MMTLQEIFDTSALHLLTQNLKSAKSGSGECAYRGQINPATGKPVMCGVGVFIAEEVYYPTLEGQIVTDGSVMSALQASGVLSQEEIDVVLTAERFRRSKMSNVVVRRVMLLADIQVVHDDNCVYDWPDRLVDLAAKYKLNIDVLREFAKS